MVDILWICENETGYRNVLMGLLNVPYANTCFGKIYSTVRKDSVTKEVDSTESSLDSCAKEETSQTTTELVESVRSLQFIFSLLIELLVIWNVNLPIQLL